MDKYESNVNGTVVVYTSDGIQLGDSKILFTDMSDITILDETIPAWSFDYQDRRLKVPYDISERELVEPFIRRAIGEYLDDLALFQTEQNNQLPDIETAKIGPVGAEPNRITSNTEFQDSGSFNTRGAKKGAKTIICKHCGEEILKKAKICPNCGMKNKKPIYKRVWFIILCIILVIGIVGKIAGGSGDKTEVPEDSFDSVTKTEATESGDDTESNDDSDFEDDESSDTVFSPEDVSDSTIESIRTYDDYLAMYKKITDDYFANYEKAIKGTVLYDESTFQQMKDEYDKAYEEQKKQYGSMGSKKLVGKDDLVTFLKEYRDGLKEYTDSIENSL